MNRNEIIPVIIGLVIISIILFLGLVIASPLGIELLSLHDETVKLIASSSLFDTYKLFGTVLILVGIGALAIWLTAIIINQKNSLNRQSGVE